MIQDRQSVPAPEPAQGRPVASAEAWLGKNAAARQRLWERLNPRHRRLLRVLARALAQRQAKERIPEGARGQLLAALDELERLARRIEQILSTLSKPQH